MNIEIQMMQVGMIYTNCYILASKDTKAAVVIDPGGDQEVIEEVVKENGYDVKAVLLTHGHYDHTGAAAYISKLYDVPIYMMEEDHKLDLKSYKLLTMADNIKYIKDNDKLVFEDLEIEVMHTPGHSKGSVVYRIPEILFTGDTLFCGSCGRTDLEGGSFEEILRSLKRIHDLEGEYDVLPGHDRTSTLSHEREKNYYMKAALKQ